MKYIPVNGLKFTNSFALHWFGVNNRKIVEFDFFTKKDFENLQINLCNYSKYDKFDSIVRFDSQCHNSYEVQAIKSLISLLHIVTRMQNTNKRLENYLKDFSNIDFNINKEILIMEYDKKESDYWKNENLYEAYFDNDNKIVSSAWNVNLGGNPVNRDCFERFSLRYFDDDCADEYNAQFRPLFNCHMLEVNQAMVEKYADIFELIYSGKENYRKIQSVSYLYFDILNLYRNSNLAVMTIATIFETLLLKKNEDNQRKKVSVRAACIVADGMSIKRKNYIANGIYMFYEYRNAIVHDGKSYLDFVSENDFCNILSKMKNLIYCIIKYYVDNKIETINEVKEIVTNNMKQDKLENAFKYITINSNDEEVRLASDYLIFYGD